MRPGDDLLVRLDELRRSYNGHVSDYLARIRSEDEERILEAQTREWFLDRLLVAFGWGGETLMPEFPAEARTGSEKRWHMDYFGHAHLDDNVLPLLIVEAKRPNSKLLDASAVRGVASYYDVRMYLLDGLAGTKKLPGDWEKWVVKQCAGYVERVHALHGQFPRCVCLTNGDWFVLFTDPKAAFVTKSASVDDVVTFPDWDAFCAGLSQARPHLEVERLLGALVPQKADSVVALADLIRADGVPIKVLRGLRLNYASEQDWDGVGDLPDIKMIPVVLIKSAKGQWAYVEGDPSEAERLPRAQGGIPKHLAAVEAKAEALLADLRAVLEVPELTELEEHLRDVADRSVLPPVRKITSKAGVSRFLLVTGTSAHFIRAESESSASCGYHQHAHCPSDQRAPAPGIRSVSEKSFFKAGEPHVCGHLRARQLRGTAGVLPGGAVCHIYAFETSMCCRTCVFENSCFANVMMTDHMPCQG